MRFFIRVAMVSVFVLAAAPESFTTRSLICPARSCRLQVRPEREVFAAIGPVIFHVTLQNLRNASYYVNPDAFPFGFELEELLSNGCWLSHGGMIPARGGRLNLQFPRDNLSHYTELKQDQSYTQEVDVTPFVRAIRAEKKRPGNWTVVQGAQQCGDAPSKKLVEQTDGTFFRIKFWHDGLRSEKKIRDGRFSCSVSAKPIVFVVRSN